jgi:hypothetical protein
MTEQLALSDLLATGTAASGPITFDEFHRGARALAALPRLGAAAVDCPVCHARAGQPCVQTCETNRAS